MSNEQEIPAAQEITEAEIDQAVLADAELSEDEAFEKVVDQVLEDSEPSVDELKQELEATKLKAQENWDKALRVQAEMENLKRRVQKDLEDAHKFALTKFAKELLPVLDSVVLGLQAATGESEEVQKFREGSELTIKQFEAVLAKFNVEAIEPMGQVFNAELHQAVVMQAVEGAEPNTVVNVFQKGYTLNGRLLRPAMVVVAKDAD
jgi:molecular chaperone GrpE